MVKPAMSIVGVRRVGKRLHIRLVYSEKVWIGLRVSSSMRKQLEVSFLIFVICCQLSWIPPGKSTPLSDTCTVTVEIPRSGETSILAWLCCLASNNVSACTYDSTIGLVMNYSWMIPFRRDRLIVSAVAH